MNMIERLISTFTLFCMMVGIGDLVFHISLFINPHLEITNPYARYYIACVYALIGFFRIDLLPKFNHKITLWDAILGNKPNKTKLR